MAPEALARPGPNKPGEAGTVGPDQALAQNVCRGRRVVQQWERRNPPMATLPPSTHTPRPQVQVTSQLGARASLELSLRSWLRLASRSLRSVSSCARSVCASVRKDSLCSTADRQAGRRVIRPVPPPQLHPPSPASEGAENPYPTLHRLSLCGCFLRPHRRAPWSHFHALGSHWLVAPPYRLGRRPGRQAPGR